MTDKTIGSPLQVRLVAKRDPALGHFDSLRLLGLFMTGAAGLVIRNLIVTLLADIHRRKILVVGQRACLDGFVAGETLHAVVDHVKLM